MDNNEAKRVTRKSPSKHVRKVRPAIVKPKTTTRRRLACFTILATGY